MCNKCNNILFFFTNYSGGDQEVLSRWVHRKGVWLHRKSDEFAKEVQADRPGQCSLILEREDWWGGEEKVRDWEADVGCGQAQCGVYDLFPKILKLRRKHSLLNPLRSLPKIIKLANKTRSKEEAEEKEMIEPNNTIYFIFSEVLISMSTNNAKLFSD